MSKYVYPAIFTTESDGKVSVSFPDVENCYTGGNNIADAIEMAEDVLCLCLYNLEKDSKTIPTSTNIKNISINNNQIVSLVHCNTDFYKHFYENKSVRKTLTIPSWLNDTAISKNINFSKTLQNALIEQIQS